MRSQCFFSLLVLSFLLLVAPVRAQRAEHLFYYVDTEESFNSLKANISKISVVAPQAFSVDEDGIVWGAVDPRVIELAKQHKVGVMPLVVNPGFDQAVLHRLLANAEARRRTITTLVDLCKQHGFLGIQFDFENLHVNDRTAFTHFYEEAAKALHRGGFMLSIAVVHRTEDYPGPTEYHKWLFENWRGGYDLETLARLGDFVSVMTYDQHTRRTTPGPIAGIPWMRQVVEYFLRFVPPEKLSLGIPLYSMHWYTALDTVRYFASARAWSRSTNHATAVGLLERFKARLRWDEHQQVSYAMYENGGLFEYIFLEDARSFKAKHDLMKQYKLRGFSAWVLGREDQGIWKVLPTISK